MSSDDLPAATREALRVDDDAAHGRVPYVKLDGDGIHIITPTGGRLAATTGPHEPRSPLAEVIDHVITRQRARAMARTLEWVAGIDVEDTGVVDAAGQPVTGTRTIAETP